MILVTGGSGYIGSHTVLVLLQAGLDVVVIDNLCNSSAESIYRVGKLAGRTATFIDGDIRDRAALDAIFSRYTIDAVIHFAGLKAVGESVQKPLAYYENNVGGSAILFQAMAAAGIKKIVFSSSATVYGDQGGEREFREDMPVGIPSSPYGQSKVMIEQILRDVAYADKEWSIALLRYFNPVGAHESGEIGEDPQGIPNNLVPYISQVAVGRLECLSVYGNDYDTPDGTCLRDYIHVMDLAEGHVKALQGITGKKGVFTWNLGGGTGISVLDVVKAYEKASGKSIPYTIAPRRAGDLAAFWANPDKALHELGWKTKRSLDDMVVDTWRWQSKNPMGYH
ncbi:MAG: UDP-glucose 4-epimerase GalE [Cardiobacteriaceae bacterium]|nr:UDP-glucose 4-epimerase GalE [Cardiobacteriaceae bacterium]